MTTHSIFISYRRSDSIDATGRLYDCLTQTFGKEAVFKDVDSIPIGVDFRNHLNQAVSQCEMVLAIIGDRWLDAKDEQGSRRLDSAHDYVRIELESALKMNIPIVPVLVRNATMPNAVDLPESLEALAFRNAISVRSDPDFHRDVARLIEGIQTHFAGKQSALLAGYSKAGENGSPINTDRQSSRRAVESKKQAKGTRKIGRWLTGAGLATLLGGVSIFTISQTLQTTQKPIRRVQPRTMINPATESPTVRSNQAIGGIEATNQSQSENQEATQLLKQGQSLIDAEKPEAAMEKFDQAIALDPAMAEAYWERGLAYEEVGEIDKALKDLEKAAALAQRANDLVLYQEAIAEIKIIQEDP